MKFKNTKKQGDCGLGHAISWFCSKGMTVSIPLTDSQDYDLVVEIDNELKRVQVRTTTYKKPSGKYSVGLRVQGGNSKKNFVHKQGVDMKYDFLFVLTGDDDCYFMPKPINNNAIVLNDSQNVYKIYHIGDPL